MTTQTLGRFGRLRQTLLDKAKNEDIQHHSIDISVSYNTKGFARPSESSKPDKREHLVLEWLKICLNEGHIQPSQPKVGRLCGWPLRSFFCESLYIDFECWCIKNGCLSREIPSGKIFYGLTDSIFVRDGEKYHFPHLEQCQEKLASLIENKSKYLIT